MIEPDEIHMHAVDEDSFDRLKADLDRHKRAVERAKEIIEQRPYGEQQELALKEIDEILGEGY
jgi:hypothetical protein